METPFIARGEARFATPLAARYLAQLCKHFAHRLPVTLGETEGRIAFPSGLCVARAEGETLILRVEAPDADQCVQLQGVVERHLARFAFREWAAETAGLTWAVAA